LNIKLNSFLKKGMYKFRKLNTTKRMSLWDDALKMYSSLNLPILNPLNAGKTFSYNIIVRIILTFSLDFSEVSRFWLYRWMKITLSNYYCCDNIFTLQATTSDHKHYDSTPDIPTNVFLHDVAYKLPSSLRRIIVIEWHVNQNN